MVVTPIAHQPTGGNRDVAAEATTGSEPRVQSNAKLKTESGAASESRTSLEQAAQEFESLLVAQIFRTVRESGSGGWLGSGEDEKTNPTMELAESQLAKALAERGVLGLTELLTESLARGESTFGDEREQGNSPNPPDPPPPATDR